MVITLDPDVVLAPYYIDEGAETKLEPEIPVFRLDIGHPDTYHDEIRKLGLILDAEDGADEYLDWIDNRVNTVTEAVRNLSDSDKPEVFGFYGGDWGMSAGPPYGVYGEENMVNGLLEKAGLISLTGELPGDWIVVDPEWVVTANPPVIVREIFSMVDPVVGYDMDDTAGIKDMYNDITSRPEFAGTDAVRNNEVYMVSTDILQVAWFLGLQYIAKWFHPDLFPDLDPDAVHQEYLTRFVGTDVDISETGVFVYP
jgi:iron complex transport system substrate-binding protein